jgi:hypothetical protein
MGLEFNPATGRLDLIADPSGVSGDVQLNLNSGFGAISGFRWVTGELQVPGDITLDGGGSFQTVLQLVTPTAARTITFPDATGTVALVGGSSGQLLYNLNGAVAGTQGTYSDSAGHRFVLPFGYGPGAGAVVTQETNKSTTVSLNARNGRIVMNAASLAANTAVTFTFNNTQIAESDHIVLGHHSGGALGSYSFTFRCASNSATIAVRNETASSLSEAVAISFAIFKGSIN